MSITRLLPRLPSLFDNLPVITVSFPVNNSLPNYFGWNSASVKDYSLAETSFGSTLQVKQIVKAVV